LKLEPEKVKKKYLPGARWLFRLQNSDGGFPTFSRGWGNYLSTKVVPTLPDKPTGIFVSAGKFIKMNFPGRQKKRLQKSFEKALHYLEKQQRSDGSWLPLWFGNQMTTDDHTNPVYGTAKVVTYLKDSLIT
jgi:hypothetical protein